AGVGAGLNEVVRNIPGRDPSEVRLEARLARSPAATAAALVLDPDAVFRDARKRVSLVFRINVVISTVLAFLLLGGIGGAIVAGFLGKAVWAGVFGGVAAIDVLGVLVYKPLNQINQSIVQTQRLDLLFLSVRSR